MINYTRMTSSDVINAFLEGKEGSCGSLSTDGINLRSYGLNIGETRGTEKVVLDYASNTSKIPSIVGSMSTPVHVRMAVRLGAKLVNLGDNHEK